jgi:drug/metabolite transporter (DMT)-like permease
VLSTAEASHRGAFTGLDWALFVAIGGIWGSSFLLIAIGLEAFEPGLVTWLRVGVGAAVLRLAPGRKAPIAREDRARLVAVSLLWVAIPFTMFPLAQTAVSSAVAGMLNGGVPVVTAAIATALLGRLPGRVQLAGLGLGFAGVVAIALPAAGEGSSEAIGVALVVVAVLCYGLAINVVGPLQQRYGSLSVMARVLALGAIWTAPYGLVGLGSSTFSWASLAAVVALGAVGTGLAFLLMTRLVGRVGGTRGSFATYLIPVVALLLGVTIRGDEVAAVAVAGVGLVIAGAILASRPERARPGAEAEAEAVTPPA